ncbi:putative ubiquitin-protein ligase-like [Trypanosoma conorhini]|uniref:Putative ubiquitin-protein ligase-like n=1 Tax=Trypanosoma conorhini TaxID=83891 RepID=A0A3R7KV49_9TRYP|nr:putative ubiquitin-protein ligase-like [Trypanosoma conorhini]RNF10362.1 putative ubiquitin-protein ligase-like [Trypanosoma conorhini]
MSASELLTRQIPAAFSELGVALPLCFAAAVGVAVAWAACWLRRPRLSSASSVNGSGAGAVSVTEAPAAAAPPEQKRAKAQRKTNLAGRATVKGEPKSEESVQPTSVLRGYPEVDAIMVSPCQRYLFINCRSKRRARLYPQNRNRAFMARGKELQEKHFVSVDEAVKSAMGEEARVEVHSAAFSHDGERLVVSERNSDTFFLFSINGRCQLTLQSSCKLPRHMLVSTLPPWGVAGAAYDLIVMTHDKDCELEVFSLQSVEFLGKTKFAVGNALAWAQRDSTIAAAGSFLKEPRVATLQVRPNGNGIQLIDSVHVEDNAKVRVSALCLTSKNVPEFNTREYLIVFTEGGVGHIYDIAPKTVNSKTERSLALVGCFQDSSFAGWDATCRVHMTFCLYGSSYHERLAIALFQGRNVTVYRQTSAHVSPSGLFTLEPVVELHDCHEGDSVEHVVFVQHGEGLATSGRADGRHVRLWTLPPLPA